jgi:hypothetical protein
MLRGPASGGPLSTTRGIRPSGQRPYETTVDLGHLAHMDDLHAATDYLFMDDNLAPSPDAVHRAFLSPFNETGRWIQ